MNWDDFSHYLSEQLQKPIHIESAAPVAGGDIHQAFHLQTQDGSYFLKTNGSSSLGLFQTEAHSLQAIAQSNSIRCPQVYGYGIYNQQAWLLMEHLHFVHGGDDCQRGKALAQMHKQINHDSMPFGWFEDNFIGHTLQKNQWHFQWLTFYGQERLLPQLELAQINGAKRSLYDLGTELIDALPFWFQNYSPEASLLHGDLWGGNSAFVDVDSEETEAVIFDPASYYGDRETDIAMTELFGGFSQAFYQGYNQVLPLDQGYQSRKPLYNLYHILNHFNLFGGHYQQQALNTISSLLEKAK